MNNSSKKRKHEEKTRIQDRLRKKTRMNFAGTLTDKFAHRCRCRLFFVGWQTFWDGCYLQLDHQVAETFTNCYFKWLKWYQYQKYFVLMEVGDGNFHAGDVSTMQQILFISRAHTHTHTHTHIHPAVSQRSLVSIDNHRAPPQSLFLAATPVRSIPFPRRACMCVCVCTCVCTCDVC